MSSQSRRPGRWRAIHRWIRRIWVVTGLSFCVWMWYSFSAKGLPDGVLDSDRRVMVQETQRHWAFEPVESTLATGVVFFPGGGVEPSAYAPICRSLAELGHQVFLIKLPWRFAPHDSHVVTAIERATAIIAQEQDVQTWAVAGHSKGAVIACQMVSQHDHSVDALVLIGTTHPKSLDLSGLEMPVTKVYASRDGVAPETTVLANSRLLPEHTVWVRIPGGNHSQFGYYGPQLGDRTASTSRDQQQELTLAAVKATLERM